jgi:ABC-2 type transport system ATP-binding protein
MNAISINKVSKTYGGKKGVSVDALIGLDLNIHEGDVFGFLGPNGSGKSTTIKILTGQIKATSGTATLFGIPVVEAEARRRIGYLPENPSFFQFMTASEYLGLVGRVHGLNASQISESSERILSLLELDAAAARPVRGYSKGMVQRLGLAQAMLHDPDLYILDEPMSGLDPLGRALVKKIIGDIGRSGKTVFFSTHIISDVEEVCNRVGMLVKGELRAQDRVDTLLRQGIEGYRLFLALPGQGLSEQIVSAENLKVTLGAVLAQGGHIERIEPLRRDLERYFLDVVKGVDYEHP